MEHGTLIFSAICGGIGQFFKAQPRVANWIPQVLMLLVGLVWYAGNNGMPADCHGFMANFASWADWLERAVPRAAGVNGAASLLSLIPAMKTRNIPN